MANIAIIPARGGSKRIPRKNIKDFLGKPIIAYSIETAINSGLFDEVMVSTDDKEIAEIALKYGAKVPFLRSELNSDDKSNTVDVIIEVLNSYNKLQFKFDYVCCIYPTAPFVNIKVISDALNLLKSKNFSSVFPVAAFSYPIFRALKINKENKVSMIWPENLTKRSQELPLSFHDAGQFYWMSVDSIVTGKKLFTENSGVIVLNELMVQDIDNQSDWELAELKYQLIQMK